MLLSFCSKCKMDYGSTEYSTIIWANFVDHLGRILNHIWFGFSGRHEYWLLQLRASILILHYYLHQGLEFAWSLPQGTLPKCQCPLYSTYSCSFDRGPVHVGAWRGPYLVVLVWQGGVVSDTVKGDCKPVLSFFSSLREFLAPDAGKTGVENQTVCWEPKGAKGVVSCSEMCFACAEARLCAFCYLAVVFGRTSRLASQWFEAHVDVTAQASSTTKCLPARWHTRCVWVGPGAKWDWYECTSKINCLLASAHRRLELGIETWYNAMPHVWTIVW